MKKKYRSNNGVTLIALVITIVVLLTLAGITLIALTGENGIFGKTQTAKEETRKQTATEILNLKITNTQMQTYAKEQRKSTLKELAISLDPEKDKDIQSVTKTSRKVSSLEWIDDEDYNSIFTVLKEYPEYEFEIDSKLKLASINGIKIADTEKDKEIEELKTTVETLSTTITSLQTEVQELKQEKRKDYKYTLNTEREVGTWYDGTPMYELSLAVTMPTTSNNGTNEIGQIDVKNYNMKECIVYEGFLTTIAGNIVHFPIWLNTNSTDGIRMFYRPESKLLMIYNSATAYNGCSGYVTLHYSKNN